MHATLSDVLLADGARERVTADCQALVEQELAAKSGVSAGALKVAYKVVTAFAPGYYRSTVDKLVPKMLEQLQPFWTDFHTAGGGSFGDYLAKRGDEVSEALLAVTDDLAQGSPRGAVVKAYQAVRSGAGKHIEAALPAVGVLVEKYAA
ncbi:hypothetical protein AB0M47_03565 [Hamadaea sp. NPDC051192]|uniref:DUF6918 family protein n=1 Tax=Hamadaea sp. NPDC051192 TaxID=3154940 RepID=UPI0034237D86